MLELTSTLSLQVSTLTSHLNLRLQLLFPSEHLFPSDVPVGFILGGKCRSAVHAFRARKRRHVLPSYIPILECSDGNSSY
jgi:hypothetical protein